MVEYFLDGFKSNMLLWFKQAPNLPPQSVFSFLFPIKRNSPHHRKEHSEWKLLLTHPFCFLPSMLPSSSSFLCGGARVKDWESNHEFGQTETAPSLHLNLEGGLCTN